jgi:hypothetical protein
LWAIATGRSFALAWQSQRIGTVIYRGVAIIKRGLICALLLVFARNAHASSLTLNYVFAGFGGVDIGEFNAVTLWESDRLSLNNYVVTSALGDVSLGQAVADTTLYAPGVFNPADPTYAALSLHELSLLSPAALLNLQPDSFIVLTMTFDILQTGITRINGGFPVSFPDALRTGSGVALNGIASALFLDLEGDTSANYVIEAEGPLPTPEPAPLLLLLTGVSFAILFRRKLVAHNDG